MDVTRKYKLDNTRIVIVNEPVNNISQIAVNVCDHVRCIAAAAPYKNEESARTLLSVAYMNEYDVLEGVSIFRFRGNKIYLP